jgi:hypothetical protein
MLHLMVIVLVICAFIGGLALARLIANWFADR